MPKPEIPGVLEQVAALLEGGWTQRQFAKDKDGKFVINPWDSQAVSFCVSGGVMRICRSVYDEHPCSRVTMACLNAIHSEAGLQPRGNVYMELSMWNDAPERTAEKVIAVVRAAAKREAGD